MTDNAKELLALSDSELLKYCRDDANKWAAAFSAIKSAQGWGSNDIDEALMTTWFANAIEQATSCRLSARQQASVDSIRRTAQNRADFWSEQSTKTVYRSAHYEVIAGQFQNIADALAKCDIFEKVEG